MIRLCLAALAVLGSLVGLSAHAAATPPIPLTAPAVPPAQVCGDHDLLDGPATPPTGAVVVPAGNNANLSLAPSTTYWFAPGVHTLGPGKFAQLIPEHADVFIGAPGAVLDGKHRNRYAFTQHATGVRIEHLTVRNFGVPGGNGNEGVVNHDAGHDWIIRYNTITHNAGAGVFVGSGDVVTDTCLSANGQYGFSAYEPAGIAGILVSDNEIAGNNTDDWETIVPGCGCTGGGKFWDVDGADVTGNWVHDNHGPGLWADTNDNDFAVVGNYIDHNDGEGVFYEISYNARIAANTFIGNAVVYGRDNPGFPTAAVYLSESGGDARVPARWHTIAVTGNRFVDNWSGVVLWENADRFCGSPANSSSGDCTLVNPGVANLDTCAPGTIDAQPYYDDCRWKTQHVRVADNSFVLHAAQIAGCTTDNSCGLQGLLSNYGTYPHWSPYQGEVIEHAITRHQDDLFRRNHYVGPWHFMVRDQSNVIPFGRWRAAPLDQDVGSTFHPGG